MLIQEKIKLPQYNFEVAKALNHAYKKVVISIFYGLVVVTEKDSIGKIRTSIRRKQSNVDIKVYKYPVKRVTEKQILAKHLQSINLMVSQNIISPEDLQKDHKITVEKNLLFTRCNDLLTNSENLSCSEEKKAQNLVYQLTFVDYTIALEIENYIKEKGFYPESIQRKLAELCYSKSLVYTPKEDETAINLKVFYDSSIRRVRVEVINRLDHLDKIFDDYNGKIKDSKDKLLFWSKKAKCFMINPHHENFNKQSFTNFLVAINLYAKIDSHVYHWSN